MWQPCAAAFAPEPEKLMISVVPKNELKKLAAKAEADGLTLDDLAATCEEFDVAPQDALNELSIVVAQGYLAGTWTYDFCDGVMNGIINAVVDLGMTSEMPQPVFSLYQAFDEGERIRSDDPSETDPGEKYTRPVVQEIMRALAASF
jgi:hypothetical protein